MPATRSWRLRPGRERQHGVLSIAPERALELQAGAGRIGHRRQYGLKIVTRRDIEHRQPSPQQRTGYLWQTLLTAKIDDMQAAAGLEPGYGVFQNAQPIGNHREAIRDHHVIEPGNAEQNPRVKHGSVAV